MIVPATPCVAGHNHASHDIAWIIGAWVVRQDCLNRVDHRTVGTDITVEANTVRAPVMRAMAGHGGHNRGGLSNEKRNMKDLHSGCGLG